MCDICEKHADRYVRWYFNPENFRDELVERDAERAKLIKELIGYGLEYYIYNTTRLAKPASSLSLLSAILKPIANRKAYSLHAGQVITLEEAIRIAELAHGHVLIQCYCRWLTGGVKAMTCLNFGLIKHLWPKYKPSDPVQELTPRDAVSLLKSFDEAGYVHAVFWAKVPYVIAICNCEKRYCTAIKNRLVYGIENSYKKGHFVARIYEGRCNLCGGSPRCVNKCPFGAVKYTRYAKPPYIDETACFGCGICRTACDVDAIVMVERVGTGAAQLW